MVWFLSYKSHLVFLNLGNGAVALVKKMQVKLTGGCMQDFLRRKKRFREKAAVGIQDADER